MEQPRILRIRYVPSEVIDISGDRMTYMDENVWITKWLPIKPRRDFHNGESYTFYKEGYKVSRFMDKEGQLIYWYCDIIDVEYDQEQNTYRVYDLLVDVRILPDGRISILDLEEMAEALETHVIPQTVVIKALRRLNLLLKRIEEVGIEGLVRYETGDNFK